VLRGRGAVRAICIILMGGFLLGGCAVLPGTSGATSKKLQVAERDVLADAVARVESAPWPKPQAVSFFSRISGGGGNVRVQKSDSIEAYLDQLHSRGPGFRQLKYDAGVNLVAADRLEHTALKSLTASRRSMNDVVLVETAIQALRENWQIYFETADALKKSGEVIDDNELNALQDDYRRAIKDLGDIADMLAEAIERDRSKIFATQDNFTGL
jgi:hypothetical protein